MKLVNSVLGVFAAVALLSCDQFKVTKTENGDRLQIHEEGDSKKVGKEGDILTFDLVIKSSVDSVFKDTYKEGQPFKVPLQKGQFKGSFENALFHIAEGDSTTVLVSADSLFTKIQQPLPPGVTKGSDLKFTVKMRKIQTMKEFEKEMNDKKVNEGKFVDEFAAKNLKNPIKTADGIQYSENKIGTGATPVAGDSVIVNYIGKFMEGGKPFDQSAPNEPFTFVVGSGAVIPGWDKALLTMKKGGKSTFVIPSKLAYGEQGAGGVIPPNTSLVFEIELIDIRK
jgi:FKBP-type peptidyl-prolyl cis-trans isomerase FkpA